MKPIEDTETFADNSTNHPTMDEQRFLKTKTRTRIIQLITHITARAAIYIVEEKISLPKASNQFLLYF